MKQFLIVLFACLLSFMPSAVLAVDVIPFMDTPGQALYVRVQTSPTSTVSVSFAEGTIEAAGYYYVADTVLDDVLTIPGTFPYKIFVGAIPSDTAADQQVGMGVLRNWTGTTILLDTPQTGDSFARIGANGSGLVNLASQASINILDDFVDDLEGRLTATRAAFLDNLNGHVPQTGNVYPLVDLEIGQLVAMIPSGGRKAAGEGLIATNLDQVETGGGGVGGGGGLSFTAYVGSVDRNRPVIDVVQGELKVITVIVQANTSFADPIPANISVDFRDRLGNTETIANANITRITQDGNFQVMRFTMTAVQSAALAPGFIVMEVTMDTEKVQIVNSLRILQSL